MEPNVVDVLNEMLRFHAKFAVSVVNRLDGIKIA